MRDGRALAGSARVAEGDVLEVRAADTLAPGPADPDADRILEALGNEGVYLMSILQFDSPRGTRQSSVLITAENGIAFGAFLNALLGAIAVPGGTSICAT